MQNLTETELQIAVAMSELLIRNFPDRFSMKEEERHEAIAKALQINKGSTVDKHLERVYEKLNLHSLTELVLWHFLEYKPAIAN